MPGNDALKPRGVEHASFDELEQPGLALGPPGLERNRDQILGGEHTGGCAGDIFFDGLRQRFLNQRTGGGKELHRPSGNLAL